MDNFIPLESIRIANPCSADWDKMHGDDRARFCSSCEKHVYNLSDMTRRDAENLVNEKEGRLCVQFYQRADGTMLTDNCPIPLRPARNGARWMWRSIGAGVAAVAALFSGFAMRDAAARARIKTGQTKHVRTAGRPTMKGRPATRTMGRPAKKTTKKSTKNQVPPPIALTGIVAPPQKTPPKTQPAKPREIPVHRPNSAPIRGEAAPTRIAPVRTMGAPAVPQPTPTPKPKSAQSVRGEMMLGDIGPSQ